MKFTFLFVTFFVLVINHLGFAIRITRFVVPTVASYGAVLDLDCAYDLENDQLYDVKWYKDLEEFFRCKSNGEVQEFEVDGIQLYHSKKAVLGSCPVSLTVINSRSAGQYRCEISTEAPEFKTTAKSVVLRISSVKPSKRIQGGNDAPMVSATTNSTNNNQNNGTGNQGAALSVFSLFIITLLLYAIYIVQ